MSVSDKKRARGQSWPKFSSHHPMIPKRYVPEWQLDMKNRALQIQNGNIYGRGDNWKGHISYFLQGRERLSATSHRPYQSVLEYSRTLHRNSSHFSRFNSSLMTSS